MMKQLLTIGKEIASQMQQSVRVFCFNEIDAQELIACGADEALIIEGNNSWMESYANGFAKIAEMDQPAVVLIGGTQRGKDMAAKIAAILDAGLVTDANVIRYEDGVFITERMLYGGLAVCTEEQSSPAFITVPPRTYEEAANSFHTGEIIHVQMEEDTRVHVNSVCKAPRERVNLTKANKVICVGRGVKKQEDMTLIGELAAVLQSEIGCTRSIAEDYNWLPSESYIGLSGQKIKPQLYLSLGVSGQVQHVAGIRDSKIIVAVDSNENAPIFAAADYGIVGDLYQVVPELIKALRGK